MLVVHAPGLMHAEAVSAVFLHSLLWRQSLSLDLERIHLPWLSGRQCRTLSSDPSSRLQLQAAVLGADMNLNSDPQVYTRNTLPTEPFPSPKASTVYQAPRSVHATLLEIQDFTEA